MTNPNKLADALLRYGRHDPDCSYCRDSALKDRPVCTCGFHLALAEHDAQPAPAPVQVDDAQWLFVAMDDDGAGHLTWCNSREDIRAAVWHACFDEGAELLPEHVVEIDGNTDLLIEDGAVSFEGDPGLRLIRLARSSAAHPPAPAADGERAAQLIAHRACCGTEHDPANGKLHGYCVVCGVPWPCEYAGKPPATAADGAGELPLTASVLADALECFWNASLSAAHRRDDSTAFATTSSAAEGFAAVATRLREHAALASQQESRK